MKNMWKLSNYIFCWMLQKGGKAVIGTSIGLGVITLLTKAFVSTARETEHSHFAEAFLPYESVIDGSLIPFIFIIGFVLLLGIFFVQAKGHFVNGKSIYTLMTLPMKRSHLYFAFLFAGIAIIMLYFMLWLILIIAAYFPIMTNYAKVAAQEVFYVSPEQTITGLEAARENGLYLAFQRSMFLYTIFPTSLIEAVAMFGAILLIVAALLFAGLHYGEPFAAGTIAVSGLIVGLYTITVKLRWFEHLNFFYGQYARTAVAESVYVGFVCWILFALVLWFSIRDLKRKYNI